MRDRLPTALPQEAVAVDEDGSHVCIRRLELPLSLDSEESDERVSEAWGRALAALVAQALRPSSPGVVRYDSELDALVDLVVSVSTGRWDRLWAWHQVGLLDRQVFRRSSHLPVPDAEPGPVFPPAACVLRAFARRPALIPRVVDRVVARAGVGTLDRVLGPGGWRALAVLVLDHVGSDVPVDPAGGRPDAGRSAPTGTLVDAFSRCGLHPTRETARAWAVLGLAADAPAMLLGPDRQALVATVEARLLLGTARFHEPDAVDRRADEAGDRELRPVRQRRVGGRRATDNRGSPSTEAPHRRRIDPVGAPTRPEPRPDDSPSRVRGPQRLQLSIEEEAPTGAEESGRHTAYAGLLFLLATAAEAGIPDRLLNDHRLADLPLPWSVHAVGRALAPVGIDDPAVLALAGLAAPPDRKHLEPGGAEFEAVADTAAAWRQATVQRVRETGGARADGQDSDTIFDRVVRRAGHVLQEPGWIEVVLDVADTDVVVRRAGLDLDPGWVPWLGSVVRFRYE
ncbi:MAG TPA: hypothetical protein VFU54_16710 [Actinomycetota bacterium]|nr:hypothetical protein [Actinomycetota bacterium]